MVWILATAVDLEGVSDADRLLTIPCGIVQPRCRQDRVARRHRRQIHIAVRVTLHRRRVREIGGTHTSVAANESACDGNEKVMVKLWRNNIDILYYALIRFGRDLSLRRHIARYLWPVV